MLEGFSSVPVLTGSAFMSVTDNGINFNKNVLLRMKKPKYVQFLINRSAKKVAIQACDNAAENAVQFYKDNVNIKYGVRYNNKDLETMVAAIMDWDLSSSNYRIDGVYLDDEHAMLFDLATARKFEKKTLKTK